MTDAEREFTGRHMLALILAFFGVVVAVNVLMATLAGRTWTGLLVKSAYVASQEYNSVLDAARKQDELGWKSALTVRGDGLEAAITDSRGRAIPNLTVTVKLARTTHERDDATLALAEREGGGYFAPARLKPGLWRADVTATDPSGRFYRQEFRLLVREGN